MPDHAFDVQYALDALRKEIQADRLSSQNSTAADRMSMQTILTNGLDSIHRKLDEQQTAHSALVAKVTDLDTRVNMISKGLWSLWVSFVSTVAASIAALVFGHPR